VSAGTVVVLRALGLGDLCTALPALRGLRRWLPDHDLVLAAPAWQAPIAAAAGVDRVVDVAGLQPLPSGLGGVDVAVNLHGCGPTSSAHLADLAPGRLLAFRHDDVPATCDGPPWRSDEHEIDRWCRLLAECGVDADPDDGALPPPADLGDAPATGPIVVHPGAAAPGRRWPASRFARVVRQLHAHGHTVVLTGSAGERALCDLVLREAACDDDDPAPRPRSLAGHTDLVGLWGLLASARALLSNDTGVSHLAAALATPSVVLFGPTPPARWGPRSHGPQEVLWKGRRGDPHSRLLDPGLAAIGVDEVLDRLDRVIR